ncbi:MAG: 16S rRNA (cytidine(1402)-2'-O)-methyltransferase, partial [Elusimicrobia bacterium]|nr:16S rRNA (cytidine(1402)-2'-O)-methyltransferase [Elusimicrobiota bacterium]
MWRPRPTASPPKRSSRNNPTQIHLVATPIGNLKDITLRALEVLGSADVILCEDTRVTKKLLAFHGIVHKELWRLNERFLPIERLTGKKIALVTDSGTPGISDPGARLLNYLLDRAPGEFQVIPVPGPSASVAAASASGLAANGFCFLGFLPRSKTKMLRELERSLATGLAVVFYESPHRIMETMTAISQNWPGAKTVLCRELTKMYEEILRGRPEKILEELSRKDRLLGEF